MRLPRLPRKSSDQARRKDSVVAAVEEQTAQAADLASIAGQDRLTNPITNPAVRPHADRLRNEQHRQALNADHGRKLRTHRVADRRAAHAERALEAIQQAREASSAARSVLALHTGRSRFMGATLAASVALSVGAASGVAALATEMETPALAGWLAEVGFTGMTTTVILYRSHLSQHGGKITGWQSSVLWLLMIAPLMASMAANLAGAGPVGVACSAGAAAFSLLSYVIADASATAIHAQATKVTGEDEADLHSIATGDDLLPGLAGKSKPEVLVGAASPRPVVAETSRLVVEQPTTPAVAPPTTPPTNHLPIVTTPVGGWSTGEATAPELPVGNPDAEATNQPPTTQQPPVGNQDTNHSGDEPTNQPDPPKPTIRKRATNGDAQPSKPTSEENARAVVLYRESVAGGQPLSQRALAARFPGRSSYWARDRIKEAGLRPVGRPNQPTTQADTNHSDDQPVADEPTDRATNHPATNQEATG